MNWCYFASRSCLLVVVLQVVLKGIVILLPPLAPQSRECQIPAIYNFGDSNSDTGSNSAAFGRAPHPNGITFFGKPAGRICDGRLIIDFIAEKLRLPYVSAYLDAIEANFEHGADFAAYGATIQPVDSKLYESGANPFALNIQLLQFQQLRQRSDELYKQARSSSIKARLPRPEDFSEALYMFDIGQNDIDLLLKAMTEDQAREHLPKIINHLVLAIKNLHQGGARRFWIHNTGPFGCLPISVKTYPSNKMNFDELGCVESYNDLAQEYNQQLKDRVFELRANLQDMQLVYVDIYSAKYSLIKNAKQNGFFDPFSYCCEDCAELYVSYWNRQIGNETTLLAIPCDNPINYISWDGVHYTEAANQWVANKIFDGYFSDPPLPFHKSCTMCKKLVNRNNSSTQQSMVMLEKEFNLVQ